MASPATKSQPRPNIGAPRIPSYLLPSLGIALLVTAAYYGVLLLGFGDTYFTVMFVERTAIPYMTTYLMFLGVILLLGSYLHLRLEARNFDRVARLFTDVASVELETAPTLKEGLSTGIKRPDQRGLVFGRVARVLNRVETRGSAGDVAALLSEQAEIDRAVFSQSFATVRFIAWLIPVLGFIGTVGGISFAIARFPDLFAAGADSLKDNIGPVTGNLGVAFETTLLALIQIAVILFVLYAVNKRGNELLNAFDEFCLDQLLGKVRGAGIAEDTGPFSDLTRVLSEHVERMEAKFEKGLERITTQLVENESERWKSFTDSFKAITTEHEASIRKTCELMSSEAEKLAGELKNWEPQFRASMEDMVRSFGDMEKERLDALTSAVGRIEKLIKTSDELRALQQTLQANLEAVATAGDMQKAVKQLNESVGQLHPVLAELQKRRRMQVRIMDEIEE